MNTHTNRLDIGLLLLRLVVGGVFLYHGITKLGNMEGANGTIAFFGSVGFAPFFAYLVAFIELLGGLLLMFGFFPRLITSLFGFIMLMAIFKVKGGDFKKAELDIVLLFASAAIFFAGVGSKILPMVKQANKGPYLS